jgi:hypothetical protein
MAQRLKVLAAAGAAVGLALGLAAVAQASAQSSWQVVYKGHDRAGAQTALRGVTAPGRNDAWAAGSTAYRNGSTRPAFLHWNGARWQPVSIPGTAGFLPLAVESTSTTDVWMFGTADHSDDAALHLVDGSWQKMQTPPFGADIAVLGGSDVWMIGQGGGCDESTQTCTTQLQHWNGDTWSSSTIGAMIEALAGWGGHLWAAGLTDLHNAGTASATGRLTLYVWTHGGWQPFASPHPMTGYAPSIDSNGAVIAAGPRGQLWMLTFPVHGRVGLLHYWTGSRWKRIAIPAALTAPQYTDGLLTYDLGHGVWFGPYLHWTGHRWVKRYPEHLAGHLGGGYGFLALSPISGSGSLWAVGFYGVHLGGDLVVIHGRLP